MKFLRGTFLVQLKSLLLLSGSLLATTSPLFAQTMPLETITVTGNRGNNAVDIAPTSTPLDAIQPTSVITQDFIQKNLPMTANYDEAIKFSPSVFDTAPNGPGLAESQNISIRGFQDGQYSNRRFQRLHPPHHLLFRDA
jgi:iron complex outermembrane receptor protein